MRPAPLPHRSGRYRMTSRTPHRRTMPPRAPKRVGGSGLLAAISNFRGSGLCRGLTSPAIRFSSWRSANFSQIDDWSLGAPCRSASARGVRDLSQVHRTCSSLRRAVAPSLPLALARGVRDLSQVHRTCSSLKRAVTHPLSRISMPSRSAPKPGRSRTRSGAWASAAHVGKRARSQINIAGCFTSDAITGVPQVAQNA